METMYVRTLKEHQKTILKECEALDEMAIDFATVGNMVMHKKLIGSARNIRKHLDIIVSAALPFDKVPLRHEKA